MKLNMFPVCGIHMWNIDLMTSGRLIRVGCSVVSDSGSWSFLCEHTFTHDVHFTLEGTSRTSEPSCGSVDHQEQQLINSLRIRLRRIRIRLGTAQRRLTMFVSLMFHGVSLLLLSGPTVSEVFLNVSPNRQQFFIRGSVSLSCVDDGRPADGWTVMKHSGGHNLCDPGLREFGIVNGSSVVLTDLDNKDTSFYWCENSDGRMSEYTSIRIEDHVILDIPALPVMTGSDLILRCLTRDGSTVAAFFFINGTLVGPEPKAELKIASIQKSDEGAYACTAVTYGRSPVSFVRVRDPPSATRAPPPPPSPTQLQVSLKVSPDLQQFVKGSSVSVSCVEDGRAVGGWTVKRTIDNRTLECGAYCSMSERWIGSSCDLNGYMTFTGVYWCETRTGLKTEHVTVSITDRPLILEIPALPVITGSDVTLRCRLKGNSVTASFYKNHSLVGSGSELIISHVQRSDEGLYSCATDEYESVWSWLRVKGQDLN